MANKKLTYAEQIKHPNWQKRRLEMLEYYGWACAHCDAKDKMLHVHHKQYFKGRMAWEYSNEELAVLCEDCHKDHHRVEERIKEILSNVNLDEAYSLLAGYFGRYDDVDPGIVEEARQGDALTFAVGFTGSLCSIHIEHIEEVAEFSVGKNKHLQDILNRHRHYFGHKDA